MPESKREVKEGDLCLAAKCPNKKCGKPIVLAVLPAGTKPNQILYEKGVKFNVKCGKCSQASDFDPGEFKWVSARLLH